MDALQIARARYTAKAYDLRKKIRAELFDKLLEILRLSPSSTNAQPWHFLIAESAQAKARIAKSMEGSDDYNIPKVMNASHVLVFCAVNDVTDTHLEKVNAAEIRDGRYTAERQQANTAPRAHYVRMYRSQGKMQSWIESQLHIALGQLLWAAEMEGVNSTAIGGFRTERLDAELNLAEQGLHSVLIVCLGYRSAEDRNADKPKSRLSRDEIFSYL
ncbi:oxygen-insensitive NAD(P)H nitroreductase [Pasteurellaceae bacterium LIM206]|nr:oxygen-insensitive NAD(P)H nitroreductase [Pasteurellaceae bacterium LIM206]